MKEFRLDTKDSLSVASSGGQLLKWFKDGYYIKTSSYNDNNFKINWNYESYSELIACRLFKELGVNNVVMYYPCEIVINNSEKVLGCYSKSFLNKGEEYSSIAHIVKARHAFDNYPLNEYDKYNSLISDIQQTFNIQYKDELDKILELDYLILNTDRHLGNFGLIYNYINNTFRVAPIFDNGASMFAHKNIDDFEYDRGLDKYLFSRPFYSKHDQQIQLVSHRQFKNKNIDKTLSYIQELTSIGLSQHRVNFISNMLMDRIHN